LLHKKRLIAKLNSYKDFVLIAVLLIFYSVGTFGILNIEQRDYFLGLTPLNLLLSFVILVIASTQKDQKFLFFLLLCFATGLIVEWIGVNTGWLFGNYYYGNNLGYKLGGVPILIGINWALLVVCSSSLIFKLPLSNFYKAITAAILMTGLDFLMEPVAIKSDFWFWIGKDIPLFNYICWFLISFVLQMINFYYKIANSNKVHNALFIILVLFFATLNFL
jgi:putative membrane protein